MKKLEFVEFALVTAIGIIILLLASGCLESTDPEAPTKCTKLLHETCNAVAACTEMSPSQCLTEIKQGIDCTTAIGVSDDYNVCMLTIPRLQCSLLIKNGELTLPTTCIGAVLFEE